MNAVRTKSTAREHTMQIRPGINLFIEPNCTVQSDDFHRKRGGYAFLLDGFDVDGKPSFKIRSNGPCSTSDHHSVNRLQMLSTQQQVFEGIRFYGWLPVYTRDGRALFNIYLNRLDPDSALAAFHLVEHELVSDRSNPELTARLKFIVNAVNILDVSAGMSAGDLTRQEIELVNFLFYPCFELIINHQLGDESAPRQYAAFEDIRKNLREFLLHGKTGAMPIMDSFDIVERHDHWVLVREIGINCRLRYAAEGINAFVAYHERSTTEGMSYTYGRLSEQAAPHFELPFIFPFLNRHYGIPETSTDKYNGGSTVGGSPRLAGCTDMPNEHGRVIDAAISAFKATLVEDAVANAELPYARG